MISFAALYALLDYFSLERTKLGDDHAPYSYNQNKISFALFVSFVVTKKDQKT